jgi:hypothetical protein
MGSINVYKYELSTGPPGWESIPGLLYRFTNTGPVIHKDCESESESDSVHGA